MVGYVSDLLAICGGRDYVFFLDAGVVDRFAQLESLHGYLLEEQDLGSEAGGKLRNAILVGFKSEYGMSAVKAMAIIAHAWLWPMLSAIVPGDEYHILDVLPVVWPRSLAWLEAAAADPQAAIDGTLSLRASLEAGGQRVAPLKDTPNAKRKAERAQLDLDRIRGVLAADSEVRELVHEMLKAAFTGMLESTRNHAAEYLPGGPCCIANITPELRKAMDGTPTTSVLAETMFARIKRRAERGGAARHDTRIGLTMCDRDKTVDWLASKGGKAQAIWNLGRKTWRQGSGRRTVLAERRIKGEVKAPEREAKLAKKRGGRAKKAAEHERIKAITVASKYSELKAMGNAELSDQLKYFKVVEKQTGFTTTGSGPAMRLQLQSLIFEKFGAGANDLADGDSGVEGRGVRRRKVGGAPGSGKKRARGHIVQLHGWEWDAKELFVIDCLIGKMVADGGEVPGRTGVPAGTVLYKVLWEGFPPEIATWEEEDEIPCGEVDFVAEYEARLQAEAEEDAASEAEDESDDVTGDEA